MKKKNSYLDEKFVHEQELVRLYNKLVDIFTFISKTKTINRSQKPKNIKKLIFASPKIKYRFHSLVPPRISFGVRLIFFVLSAVRRNIRLLFLLFIDLTLLSHRFFSDSLRISQSLQSWFTAHSIFDS